MSKYKQNKYNPISDENLKSLRESINFVKKMKIKNNNKSKSNTLTKENAA